MCAAELAVQIFTDTARSGFHQNWLLLQACRIFFVVWGGVSSLAFGCFTAELYAYARSTGLVDLPSRLLLTYGASALCGLLLAVNNAAFLALGEITMTGGEFMALHCVENGLILCYGVLVAVLFLPAACAAPSAAESTLPTARSSTSVLASTPSWASHSSASSLALRTLDVEIKTSATEGPTPPASPPPASPGSLCLPGASSGFGAAWIARSHEAREPPPELVGDRGARGVGHNLCGLRTFFRPYFVEVKVCR